MAVPRPRAILVGRIVTATAHVVISLLLIPGYGIAGAALGCLAGQLLFALVAAALWKTRHGQLPLQSHCLAPFAASALMYLLLVVSANALPVWLTLLLSIGLYLASVILLRGVSGTEIDQGLRYALDRY